MTHVRLRWRDHSIADIQRVAEPKKSLKPDIFQEFELKEKTILSHNTAM